MILFRAGAIFASSIGIALHLWHLDSWSEEFLDKLSVLNRTWIEVCLKFT